jgi:hypothetical protein
MNAIFLGCSIDAPLLTALDCAGLTTPLMSSPRLLLRAARPVVLSSTSLHRPYATQRLDVQRLRADVDKRARNGFYKLSKMQGALAKIEPRTADAIVNDFVAHRASKDPASNIRYLAKSALRRRGLVDSDTTNSPQSTISP